MNPITRGNMTSYGGGAGTAKTSLNEGSGFGSSGNGGIGLNIGNGSGGAGGGGGSTGNGKKSNNSTTPKGRAGHLYDISGFFEDYGGKGDGGIYNNGNGKGGT